MIVINFLKANFASQARYRINFFGYIFMMVLLYGMKFLFLDSLFQYTEDLAGWSKADVLFVFYLAIMLAVLGDVFDTSIFMFYQKAVTGQLQPFLLKPVSIRVLILGRWCKPSSLILFIVLLPFGAIFYDPSVTPSLARLIVGGLCFACGLGANLTLISLMSLGNLLTQRRLPVDYIFSEIYRMTQLPPGIFPPNMQAGMLLLLPTVFCASVPAAVLLKGDYILALWFLVGAILLFLIHTLLFRRAMQNFDMLGG